MRSPDIQQRQRLLLLAKGARAGRLRLKTTVEIGGQRFILYQAGVQGQRVRFGLFGRDLLTTALMFKDRALMRDAIRFVVVTMGRRCNPKTGEEPGRGIHEFADIVQRGLSTRYNAVDVSLLLLIAAAKYWNETEDAPLICEIREGLTAAIGYLRTHLEDGLFVEDPARCGTDHHYALRATYWKDGGLPGRSDPVYPVVYTLVQAQAIEALRAAAELGRPLGKMSIQSRELERMAHRAVQRLRSDLWDRSLAYPIIALDRRGPITGVASDGLHMLAYLRPGDIPPRELAAIADGAGRLATPFGFRTYAPGQIDYAVHGYHLGAIWPFEQAFIARAAEVHELPEVYAVTYRVIDAMEELGYPELFYWSEDQGLEGPGVVPGEGCDIQLWSLAVPEMLLAVFDRA